MSQLMPLCLLNANAGIERTKRMNLAYKDNGVIKGGSEAEKPSTLFDNLMTDAGLLSSLGCQLSFWPQRYV